MLPGHALHACVSALAGITRHNSRIQHRDSKQSVHCCSDYVTVLEDVWDMKHTIRGGAIHQHQYCRDISDPCRESGMCAESKLGSLVTPGGGGGIQPQRLCITTTVHKKTVKPKPPRSHTLKNKGPLLGLMFHEEP